MTARFRSALHLLEDCGQETKSGICGGRAGARQRPGRRAHSTGARPGRAPDRIRPDAVTSAPDDDPGTGASARAAGTSASAASDGHGADTAGAAADTAAADAASGTAGSFAARITGIVEPLRVLGIGRLELAELRGQPERGLRRSGLRRPTPARVPLPEHTRHRDPRATRSPGQEARGPDHLHAQPAWPRALRLARTGSVLPCRRTVQRDRRPRCELHPVHRKDRTT